MTATTELVDQLDPTPTPRPISRFGYFPEWGVAVTLYPDALAAGDTHGWLWPGWLPRGVAVALDPTPDLAELSRDQLLDLVTTRQADESAAWFLADVANPGEPWPDGAQPERALDVRSYVSDGWLGVPPRHLPGQVDVVFVAGPLYGGTRDQLLDLVAGGVTVIHQGTGRGLRRGWDDDASVLITLSPGRGLLDRIPQLNR
jgi:hypothetical protein